MLTSPSSEMVFSQSFVASGELTTKLLKLGNRWNSQALVRALWPRVLPPWVEYLEGDTLINPPNQDSFKGERGPLITMLRPQM